MGFESYISESEAAVVAGVEISTLRRFAETGYFKVETEQDGLRLYSKSDLEKVFGIKLNDRPAARPFAPWEPPANPLSPESSRPLESRASEDDFTEADKLEEESKKSEKKAFAIENEALAPQNVETVATPGPSEGRGKIEPILASNSDGSNHTALAAQSAANEAAAQLRFEIQKHKIIAEMQDKLLLVREEEIRGLKEEREWLRSRIEKLEEKASRDQILLLSETQTIKTLISIQEQRRSPIRAALEWFGFIDAATPHSQPLPVPASIEVQNQDSQVNKKAA